MKHIFYVTNILVNKNVYSMFFYFNLFLVGLCPFLHDSTLLLILQTILE